MKCLNWNYYVTEVWPEGSNDIYFSIGSDNGLVLTSEWVIKFNSLFGADQATSHFLNQW